MSDASAGPDGVGLTHLDAEGRARMVDVGDKDVTRRTATAVGVVRLSDEAAAAVAAHAVPKGDVATIARIAGIQAAKRTPELIPLCHTIRLTAVEVEVRLEGRDLRITATTRAQDRTGVEMEALTAVTVAGLAAVDMVKAIDPGARIDDVHVVAKSGGAHGDWAAHE